MDTRVLIDVLTDKVIEYVERIIAAGEGLDEERLNRRPDGDETNSIYVLAFHTMGNVRQNTLAILGGQEDIRDRDAEFTSSGSFQNLQDIWNDLKPRVIEAMAGIGDEELTQVISHPRRGTMTGLDVLMLAATHAGEHAGQAELSRSLDEIKP